jgi:maleate cis-trans isomerase
MYGWRARIGWICSMTVIEATPYEYFRLAPEGIGFLFASLCKRDQSPEETEAALGRLPEVAKQMGKRGADYIVVNSSPMVIYGGPGSDRKIIRDVEQQAGCPATTTTTAAMDALRAVNAKKIVMASPYPDQHVKLRQFLEADGFTVLADRGLKDPLDYVGRVPDEVSYGLAKQVFAAAPQAEAVYLVGGLLRTIDSIEWLEKDLGVPVITPQPACLWSAMMKLKIHDPIEGYGSLLAKLPLVA